MPASAPLDPELFAFLRDLSRHNDREWFRANRSRFEESVRDPLLAFVAAFAPRLARLSPHFVADPRPVGGSLFRIHRDVRFSKDKRPYKTHAALRFGHEAGRDVHAPGFYLHLGPGDVFLGAGMWRPDSTALGKVREAIVEDPARWKRVAHSKRFRDAVTLEGESLKRPPRGFDPEHPWIEDLKRKDFVAVARLDEKDACAPDFAARVAKGYGACSPLVRFLTEAVGLPW